MREVEFYVVGYVVSEGYGEFRVKIVCERGILLGRNGLVFVFSCVR